jgi:beta-galactosidase
VSRLSLSPLPLIRAFAEANNKPVPSSDTNTNYPFPNCPPYVLCKNPTGCYRRSFELPQDWCQKVLSGAGRVCLLLQGVDSALTVWIDGNEVGYAQGSREPCEFDITSMLSSSRTHLLAVRVLRWCDGSYLEDQDHWWLSGIYRDVELILRPGQVRIVDYSVVAQLTPESSYTDGTLDVHVFLRGGGQPHALSSCRVICDLVDTTSGDSRLPLIPVDQHRISGAPEQVVHIFKLSVSDVRPWSAEDPNLYTVVMGVEGEQYESCRVGFRTVGVKNGQILVNGQPVMFCGVNRHEHDAWSGKVITEESMRLDILLMKQYNFNAVRNSHYPNHWLWYTLTDELGLYVVDEANIETHGQVPMCRLSDDPLWQKAYLDRVQRMYLSNRNHASIVMWSLGNESGDGRNLAACRRWLRERKDSRPIMYEGGGAVFEGTGCTNLTDVVCPMYPTPMRVEQLGTSVLGETRPVVLCEYSHAMGNSNGNLFKYFDLFRKLRRLQGGFIWDW